VKDIGAEFQAYGNQVTEKPRVMADRSPHGLRWHFTIPGSPSTTTVLCCHHSARLMGYAIAQHMVAPEKRQAKLLASIRVERDNSRVIASLLGAIYANAVA
jgi:hypothetical protein